MCFLFFFSLRMMEEHSEIKGARFQISLSLKLGMSFSEFFLFSLDIISFDCNSFPRILFLLLKICCCGSEMSPSKLFCFLVWYHFHSPLCFCVFVIEKSFFSVLIEFVVMAFSPLLSSSTFYSDLFPPYCCGLIDLESKMR